jgi:hypothetical protein
MELREAIEAGIPGTKTSRIPDLMEKRRTDLNCDWW